MGLVPGLPIASNMREVFWDEELAAIAQRWAEQCNPWHDFSRNTGRFHSLTYHSVGNIQYLDIAKSHAIFDFY